MLNQIVLIVLIALGTLLLVLIPILAPKFTAWIRTKVQNEKLVGILDRLTLFVAKVVIELDQTIVDVLKRDGKWNADEAKKVKFLAIERIKSYLGPEGLKELMVILGLDRLRVDDLISTLIEAEVRDVKIETPVQVEVKKRVKTTAPVTP